MLLIIFIILFSSPLSYSKDKTRDSIIHTDLVVPYNPKVELQEDIIALIESKELKEANIGVFIKSLKNGETLIKYNENKNFVPASSLKIVTSLAALELLGEDFRFQTKLYLDGEINQNGEFYGNIIIRGFGDPTLSKVFYEDPAIIFDNWIKELDSLGISSIKGNIIGDDNYFDEALYPEGWAWDDMSYPFSAPINALSFYENKVDIFFQQGDTIGELTSHKIAPANNYLRIVNKVFTGEIDQPSELNVQRDILNNNIEINGFLPFDTLENRILMKAVAINNPTYYLLHIFLDRLNAHNIRFRGALLDIDDWNEKPAYYKLQSLSLNESKPLSDIVTIMNKQSNNLIAETLVKTIGKELNSVGSFESGINEINKFLSKIDVNTEKINLKDGSGLSRLNLISPKDLGAVLTFANRSKSKKTFWNSLAKPGEEGTLKRRMKNTLAQRNVFAKTGSMNNISTICGFAKTRDNEELAFVVMFNNFSCPLVIAQNIQDLICMRLTTFTRNK